MAVIAGYLCLVPPASADETPACGLVRLIYAGASDDEVRDWFAWGGSKTAINQGCSSSFGTLSRTPVGAAARMLSADTLKFLFAEGGDINALESSVKLEHSGSLRVNSNRANRWLPVSCRPVETRR